MEREISGNLNWVRWKHLLRHNVATEQHQPGDNIYGVYTLRQACMCKVSVIHLTVLLGPSLPNSGWAFNVRARSYACVHTRDFGFKSHPKDYGV